MATSYPGALDAWTNPTSSTTMDATGFEHDLVHSDVFDALEAIEGELGTDPTGAQATVKARLDHLSFHASPSSFAWPSATYLNNTINPATATTYTANANSIDYAPFWCPVAVTADRVAVEVTTAQAGANARIGLYDVDSEGMPGSLITDFGEIDCSSAAVQELTISQALGGGRGYWLGLLNETASVAYRAVGNNGARTLYVASTATTTGQGRIRASQTYTSGLPNPAAGSYTLQANPPVFWLRRT